MEYNEFKEKLITELEKQYTEGSVKYEQQVKLNGVKLDGIVLINTSETSCVAPVFYISQYYKEDLMEEDIEVIAKIIISRSSKEKFKPEMIPTFSKEEFRVYDNIKDKIMPILVNTEWNSELLEQIPHREWLDLSIIYIVRYEGASIRLYNNHLDIWGVTEAELYEQAMKNLKQSDKYIRDMGDMLGVMFANGGEPLFNKESLDALLNNQDGSPRMIVVGNRHGVYGASLCLLDEVLSIVSEKVHSDKFYIAMSSVHEFIAINSNEFDGDYLKDMVTSINRMEIEEQEVLSDNIYLCEAGEIRIVE